ncbi:MAG: hypothetical protein N4A53_04140 [Pelagimonas sp.]|jgi:hypothetical protein|nr:hypothetical protein [Pelagimonas sp.]
MSTEQNHSGQPTKIRQSKIESRAQHRFRLDRDGLSASGWGVAVAALIVLAVIAFSLLGIELPQLSWG